MAFTDRSDLFAAVEPQLPVLGRRDRFLVEPAPSGL
jgi:hypothetical protein